MVKTKLLKSKAQGGLEYLIIIATVAAIASVAIVIASSSFGSNKESGQFAACKAAALTCKSRLLLDSSAQCAECETACTNPSTGDALSATVTDCCKAGKPENIYSAFAGVCAVVPESPLILATGSSDNVTKIWNASSGALLATLPTGSNNSVFSVAWSPDGTKMASSSYDNAIKNNTIKISDVSTGTFIRTLIGHTNIVYSVSWSPDGTKIVSGSYDYSLIIWNTANGTRIKTLVGHTNGVKSVAWNPNDSKIASGSFDDTVIIWDASTGASIRTMIGHSADVLSVAWSPDGTMIASGSADDTVKIWDANTGATLKNLTGHTGDVSFVAWSPDGTMIASGSLDTTVKIWDANSGALLKTITNYSDDVPAVAWSPDSTKLAFSSTPPWYGKKMNIFDASTDSMYKQFSTDTGYEYIYSIAWKP